MNYPPTKLIKSKDFHDCWYTLNKTIMRDGIIIPSDRTEAKQTKDICCTIELTGHAIKQIENKELHADCELKEGLESYLRQFIYDTDEYIKSTNEQKYTYASRMQFDCDRINGYVPVYDRGTQLVTWRRYSDLLSDVRPCLQRIWIRNLGNNKYELHTSYRSHDCYGAWQFNNIATYQYTKMYIISSGEIVKIVEYNDSLHIYDYDWEMSSRIRKPTRNLRYSYE